jgi:hypothetical protein
MYKHKAGTGDVRNHFSIAYIVDEAEAEDYLLTHPSDNSEEGEDNGGGFTVDDLTRLGDGRYEWLVGVEFVGDGTTYNFMYTKNTIDPPSEDEVTEVVAAYATEVAAQARINGPAGSGSMFL